VVPQTVERSSAATPLADQPEGTQPVVAQTPGTIVHARILGRTVRFFVANPHDAIQSHHFAGEFYEREELEIIARHFKPEGTFVDAGANVGNHTLYAAMFLNAKRVIPFEVNPRAVEILTVNLRLNDCTNVDSSFLGRGVSDRDGFVQMDFSEWPEDPNNLGAQRFSAVSPTAGEQAFPAIRLDSVLQAVPVDLVKIDLEGMELEALAGLNETVRRWRPGIFAEIEDRHFAAFDAWRLQRRYEIVDSFGRYGGKVNYMIVAQA
jgi:FkbM family methyltransferase